MLSMLSSATRVSLLVMILVLCGVNVFALVVYPDTAFKDTFAVFSNILIAITSFFFGKSTNDGGKPPVENVEKEKSAIDIASV